MASKSRSWKGAELLPGSPLGPCTCSALSLCVESTATLLLLHWRDGGNPTWREREREREVSEERQLFESSQPRHQEMWMKRLPKRPWSPLPCEQKCTRDHQVRTSESPQTHETSRVTWLLSTPLSSDCFVRSAALEALSTAEMRSRPGEPWG